MRDRPLITRVVLENFKSIAFCDVKLGPLVILVGPNGAGKSNFLSGLKFLSDCLTGSVGDVFARHSGFPRVLRRNRSAVAHLGIRVEFVTADATKGHYSVRFRAGEADGYVIEREACSIDGQMQYEARNGVLLGTDRPAPPQQRSTLYLPSHTRFSSAFEALHQWHFYAFDAKDFWNPSPAGFVQRVLKGDGSNLSNLLDTIWHRNPDVHERIVEYLSALNPAIEGLETVEDHGLHNIEFLVRSAARFSPRETSYGTVRALAVLVALFQAKAGVENVSLVGLEEPEVALHPAAAGVLFDALREASASVQVLATTHSADLLDKKEIDTDSILSVAFEDGATQIGPVDETGREVLRRHLYTAGELMRMNQLQPLPSAEPRPDEIESLLFGDLVSA